MRLGRHLRRIPRCWQLTCPYEAKPSDVCGTLYVTSSLAPSCDRARRRWNEPGVLLEDKLVESVETS